MKKQILLLFLWCCTTLAGQDASEISLAQIFNATRVNSDIELQLLNRRCKELDLALFFRRIDNSNEIEACIEFRGNILTIPRDLLQTIYIHLNSIDSYSISTAKVRVYDKNNLISNEEVVTTNARLQKCHDALEKVLGQKFNAGATPRIAICGSGGGLRAAISTAGLLKAFDEDGIFDAILYQAGVSGSTWTIAPYTLSDKDHFKDFHPLLLDRIVNGFMKKGPKEMFDDIQEALPTIAELMIRKLIFKDLPTLIDIYGFVLGETLLIEQDSNLHTGMHTMQKFVAQGQRPYPLLTAIVPHDDGTNYDWFTFSPHEVACDDYISGVPSWAFGRYFEKGASTNRAPHHPISFCLGVWGSAFSLSFYEFYMLTLQHLEPKSVFGPLLKELSQPSQFGDFRIFPAIVRNFTYKMPNLPRSEFQMNTLVDAGISINLPMPPLLNPGRKVDIIIVCDASGDVLGAQQLYFAQKYAINHNLPFPAIDYNGISNRPFSVFDDGPGSPAPIIIYVPMVKNPNYSTTFDPQDHLQKGFLNSGNFDYSLDQAHLLSGLLETAAHELKPTLLNVLKTVIQRKSKSAMFTQIKIGREFA